MYQRKTKQALLLRNNKRKVLTFYAAIIISSFVFVLGVIGILYLERQKPSFVSPLPLLKAFAIDTTNTQTSDLEKALTKAGIHFEHIDVKGETYVITLENNEEVIFSTRKDIAVQISSLQFILTRLTMEGRQFSKLDLQFDKPIIVF